MQCRIPLVSQYYPKLYNIAFISISYLNFCFKLHNHNNFEKAQICRQYYEVLNIGRIFKQCLHSH